MLLGSRVDIFYKNVWLSSLLYKFLHLVMAVCLIKECGDRYGLFHRMFIGIVNRDFHAIDELTVHF